MYSLLSRVPNRIDDLYKLVEKHIREHGRRALSRNTYDLTKDPRPFVLAILEVYDKCNKLISGAFKGDSGFTTAMDKVPTHTDVDLVLPLQYITYAFGV